MNLVNLTMLSMPSICLSDIFVEIRAGNLISAKFASLVNGSRLPEPINQENAKIVH